MAACPVEPAGQTLAFPEPGEWTETWMPTAGSATPAPPSPTGFCRVLRFSVEAGDPDCVYFTDDGRALFFRPPPIGSAAPAGWSRELRGVDLLATVQSREKAASAFRGPFHFGLCHNYSEWW